MRKILLTSLFALLGAGAFAQTSQGTITVSGLVDFHNEAFRNHDSGPGDQRTIRRNITLYPTVGYFVNDGLELGMGIGLSQFTSKLKQEEGDNINKRNSISLRPYARKYVALTEQLLLHGTGWASVGFGNSTNKGMNDSSAEVTGTSNSFGIGVYPGLTYFATPKLGFTATFGALSFSRTKDKPKDSQQFDRTSNTFTADFSPSSVGIGLGYFIAR